MATKSSSSKVLLRTSIPHAGTLTSPPASVDEDRIAVAFTLPTNAGSVLVQIIHYLDEDEFQVLHTFEPVIGASILPRQYITPSIVGSIRLVASGSGAFEISALYKGVSGGDVTGSTVILDSADSLAAQTLTVLDTPQNVSLPLSVKQVLIKSLKENSNYIRIGFGDIDSTTNYYLLDPGEAITIPTKGVVSFMRHTPGGTDKVSVLAVD